MLEMDVDVIEEINEKEIMLIICDKVVEIEGCFVVKGELVDFFGYIN